MQTRPLRRINTTISATAKHVFIAASTASADNSNRLLEILRLRLSTIEVVEQIAS